MNPANANPSEFPILLRGITSFSILTAFFALLICIFWAFLKRFSSATAAGGAILFVRGELPTSTILMRSSDIFSHIVVQQACNAPKIQKVGLWPFKSSQSKGKPRVRVKSVFWLLIRSPVNTVEDSVLERSVKNLTLFGVLVLHPDEEPLRHHLHGLGSNFNQPLSPKHFWWLLAQCDVVAVVVP